MKVIDGDHFVMLYVHECLHLTAESVVACCAYEPSFLYVRMCVRTYVHMFALLLVLCPGVAVNYKDVESIDPEYAKNLQVRMYMCVYVRTDVHMCAHTYISKYCTVLRIYMAMIQAS